MTSRRFLALGSCAAVLAGAIGFAASSHGQSKPPVFVNMTAGKTTPHRAHMGLEFALMAQKAGRKVTVFFNVDGPQLVDRRLPAGLGAKGEMSIPAQVKALAAGGATLLACPHCMEVSKVTRAGLVPGVTVANPQMLFSRLPAGVVTVSY